MTRLMNILSTKQRKNVFGRISSTVASSMSKCARPGLICKGHVMGNSHNPSLVRLQQKCGKCRTGFKINLTS